MNSTQVRSETAIETSRARRVDMKLEVVVIAVSDVDRAKRFYGGLGWRLDADVVEQFAHVDTAIDELGARRLDVGHDEMESLCRARHG